jgi:hypothetical protein
MISWFEGEELKSLNKTIKGHPWGAYKEKDNTTYLDVDDDGITDADEIDPRNSTTESVMDYVEEYGDNQTAMDSQFNAFLRENVPPEIFNVKIKTVEEKGTCYFLGVPYSCVKRRYSDISIDAMDVSQFEITIKLKGIYARSETLEGKGRQWHEAEMDLLEWEVLTRYEVIVEMVDFAGNELDPSYKKEIDGVFGGAIRFLEALWDFFVGIASAIADAVMKALSFIFEMMASALRPMLDAIVEPLWQGGSNPAISSFLDGMTLKLGDLDDMSEEQQSIGLGPIIGKSKKGASGLGLELDSDINEGEESEEVDVNLEWAKSVHSMAESLIAYTAIFGGAMVVVSMVIGGLLNTMLPIGLAILALNALILYGVFLSLIPLDTLADVPKTLADIQNALEGLNTDHGPALMLFNTIVIPFKWILGPLISNPIPLVKLGFSLGITMAALVVTGFLIQNQYKSNSALHIVALVLLLISIISIAVSMVDVAFAAYLTFGVQISAFAMLLLFEAPAIVALGSLIGFITKNMN